MSGAELRDKRLAAGLSQERLARELGVSLSAVYRWEAGTRPIRPITAYAIEAVLSRIKNPGGGPQQERSIPAKQRRRSKKNLYYD